MTADRIRRLGFALDDDPLFAGLVSAIAAAARDLGLTPVDIVTPADEAAADAVLIVGRPGRHTALLAAPPIRPRIVWSGEPLSSSPPDGHGRSLASTPVHGIGDRPLAVPRRTVGRWGRLVRRVPLPGPVATRREGVLAERLVRVNLRELEWAAARGAHLVVTSHDRAATLAAYGLTAVVVPIGFHPALAGPMTRPGVGPREVPLIGLGARSGHLRRGRLLAGLEHGRAAEAGPRIVHLDGVWGAERHARLRQARVLVDVHRIPGTFVGIRLVLALAAGVAVVTEPMRDPRPFRAGVTHLESPTDRLLVTAQALVADEPRRRALVDAGQALLEGPLRLTESLRAVIASLPGSPDVG